MADDGKEVVVERKMGAFEEGEGLCRSEPSATVRRIRSPELRWDDTSVYSPQTTLRKSCQFTKATQWEHMSSVVEVVSGPSELASSSMAGYRTRGTEWRAWRRAQ